MIIINKVIYEFIKLIFVSYSSQGIFSHKTNTLNALHVHVHCGIQYFFYFTCTVCIVYKNNLIVLTLCVCVCVQVRNLKWLGFRVPFAIVNQANSANQLYPHVVSLMESIRTYELTCQKVGLFDK